jgi:putative photosynthetic complex assembly protein
MTEIFVEPEPGTPADSTIRVPRGPLIGAGVMILLTFAVAITARRTGVGASHEPLSVPVDQRSIRFVPDSGGALKVYDALTGRLALRLEPDRNGFIFGMLRGMQYRRSVAHTDSLTPFALTRWRDGHITLDDPATGMHVAVNSFGHTQVASFEQLFTPAQTE